MRMTTWRNYAPSQVSSSEQLLQVKIALGVEKNTINGPTRYRLKNYIYRLAQVCRT